MNTLEIISCLNSNDFQRALQLLSQHQDDGSQEAQDLRRLCERLQGLNSHIDTLYQAVKKTDGQSPPKKQADLPAQHSVVRLHERRALRDAEGVSQTLEEARQSFRNGSYLQGIDLYEQLAEALPEHAYEILAELYDQYKSMPQRGNRYTLYVARDFNFGIQPGDKVLDIGSGHDPFPFATHLADYAPDDDSYGRAGHQLKRIEGKPFTACSVEDMPFADQEFDFVSCSHVLEHTTSPEKACQELMRVAKRGYIETPTRGKDAFLCSAAISNHYWAVENFCGRLIFTEYTEEEKKGLGWPILSDMHCNPQSLREKAFSALLWLKSSVVNTVLYWEKEIPYEVRRR